MKYKFKTLLKNGKPFNYSLTVPKDIVTMVGPETKFLVERSGGCVLFTSGGIMPPTKEEVEAYEFEDSRIK